MDEKDAGRTTSETIMYNKTFSELIAQKRDGRALTQEDMKFFILSVTGQHVDNSQIGAMLMAMFLKGLSDEETLYLVEEIINSGVQLAWCGTTVDKHSTGGVGDKVSIPLVPALAANGLKVPMISGRGLGWTGGTLDKLESIPGFKASLDVPTMNKCIEKHGCFIAATTDNICPADKILYKIRDVTSTVDNPQLIIGSIISKKVAGGAKYLVLDLKVGNAAFIKNVKEAEIFARKLIDVSVKFGIKTRVVLTKMNSPVGNTIGNALEIKEAVDCLHGGGPDDLMELVTGLGGELLLMSGKVNSREEGRVRISEVLENGKALEKFQEMIIAQGVDPVIASKLVNEEMDIFPTTPHKTKIHSKKEGWVYYISAITLGNICCQLGAGRKRPDDSVDPAVGIELHVKIGSKCHEGTLLMTVHHNAPLTYDMIKDLNRAVYCLYEDFIIPKRIIKIIS